MTNENVEQIHAQPQAEQQPQYDINVLINNLANTIAKLEIENAELRAIITTNKNKEEQ